MTGFGPSVGSSDFGAALLVVGATVLCSSGKSPEGLPVCAGGAEASRGRG